jgi:hypothetical protein
MSFEQLRCSRIVSGNARTTRSKVPSRFRMEARQERLADLAGRARDENVH